MKYIILLIILVFLQGCTAVAFTTKKRYSDEGISGISIYPDIGGIFTKMFRKSLKEEEK